MAQGDAYVYQWTTNTSGTDTITFTPSAGVEWIFVSSYASSNVIGLSVNSSSDIYTTISVLQTGNTSSTNSESNGVIAASGGNGWSTSNMKLVVTNSIPLRYYKRSSSSARYARFSAIVINE